MPWWEGEWGVCGEVMGDGWLDVKNGGGAGLRERRSCVERRIRGFDAL